MPSLLMNPNTSINGQERDKGFGEKRRSEFLVALWGRNEVFPFENCSWAFSRVRLHRYQFDPLREYVSNHVREGIRVTKNTGTRTRTRTRSFSQYFLLCQPVRNKQPAAGSAKQCFVDVCSSYCTPPSNRTDAIIPDSIHVDSYSRSES